MTLLTNRFGRIWTKNWIQWSNGPFQLCDSLLFTYCNHPFSINYLLPQFSSTCECVGGARCLLLFTATILWTSIDWEIMSSNVNWDLHLCFLSPTLEPYINSIKIILTLKRKHSLLTYCAVLMNNMKVLD